MRALGRSGSESGTGDATFAGGEAPDDQLSETLDLSDVWAEDADETGSAPGRAGLVAASLATIAILGWSAFYVWANFAEMQAGAAPQRWAGWVVEWTVPVALVGIGWLLAMRSSRAEATRFAAIASHMNRESAALETRLKVVNRELSLAREFLAAQSRDLEALGRIAAERLGAHAGELQALITTNGAQVEAIGTASDTALGNMNRLRDDLPVIANAARDVANQIGAAGRTAEDQLARLSGGIARLGEAGSSSEAQVARLTGQVGDALGQFETQVTRVEGLVSQRFAALQSHADAYRERIAALESEALAAQDARADDVAARTDALSISLDQATQSAQAGFAAAIGALHETLTEKLQLIEQLDRSTGVATAQRLADLREATQQFDSQLDERSRRFDELIHQRQAAFETHEAQASEVLAQRLAALDDALAQRREAQMAEIEKLTAHGAVLGEQAGELERAIQVIVESGTAARDTLGTGLDTLMQQLGEKRAALSATEAQLAQLTDSSVRMLEILQSGTRTCRDDLTAAIGTANTALEDVEARAGKVEALMMRSTQTGSDLSDYLLRTRAEIDSAEVAIASFKSHLADETEDALARLQGLRSGFARLAEESGALANSSQDALRNALGTLEAAISQAFATLDDGARQRLLALAGGIGAEAVEVLEKALRTEASTTLGKLEQSAAHAAGVGREAAIQLRDQLVKVNELTGNLEQRVTRARELAEEQVNNDFARRMALITDSLNSAAIDINGALAVEVSDTAWDAYLKGDRGIFTRRAVRLIDAGMTRDIAALYSTDEAFKANVSRYIHDFEALLRQTLSTRDGHVLSVTMLGSDMGKLYVALAQAIQRFRS